MALHPLMQKSDRTVRVALPSKARLILFDHLSATQERG